MYTLQVRQCPKCELRFGSPSERDLHLREDHRPPLQRQPEPPTVPMEQDNDASTAARPDVRLHPYVVRGIIAAAILALVAVLSWQVAMLLTVFLVAGVAGWTLRQPET